MQLVLVGIGLGALLILLLGLEIIKPEKKKEVITKQHRKFFGV